MYTDSNSDDREDNTPVTLTNGKVMRFMVASCDNDGSELRENFIDSDAVQGGPRDGGYVDAGMVGPLVLSE